MPEHEFNKSAKSDLSSPGFQYINDLLKKVGDKKLPVAMAAEIGRGIERDLGLKDGVNADFSDQNATRIPDFMALAAKDGKVDREGLVKSLAGWGLVTLANEDDESGPGTMVVSAASKLSHLHIKDPDGSIALGLASFVDVFNTNYAARKAALANPAPAATVAAAPQAQTAAP